MAFETAYAQGEANDCRKNSLFPRKIRNQAKISFYDSCCDQVTGIGTLQKNKKNQFHNVDVQDN